MSALNTNIKEFRIMRRITQKEFAEKLHKSRNVISNWERGENSPDPDTIEQICKILEVTPNMIFGWEPCPDYVKRIEKLREYATQVTQLEAERKAIDEKLAELHQKISEE